MFQTKKRKIRADDITILLTTYRNGNPTHVLHSTTTLEVKQIFFIFKGR